MVFYSVGSVFLTGATGVLGSYMLKELLAHSDCDIYCLVRAETPEAGRARIANMLDTYGISSDLEVEFLSRVKPILGDVSLPFFGLTSDAYDALANLIEVTIHSAASTNLFSRYSKIERINVGGTANIVDFALKTEMKRLTYVSTYTVMGDKIFDESVTFKETDLDIGQGFEHLSYQQSKFVAEQLIHKAGEEYGLVWNIVRPGQIFGETSSGSYPQGQTSVSGLFYDIFKTVLDTGVAIDTEGYLFDITPVDYVSRATLFLTFEDPTNFHTLHLVNPDAKSYSSVVRIIKSIGYDIDMVSLDEYKRLVFNRELYSNGEAYKSATVAAFRWWFKRDGIDFTKSCKVCCAATLARLEPHGIICAPVDDKLLTTYLEAGVRQNYFPSLSMYSEMNAR